MPTPQDIRNAATLARERKVQLRHLQDGKLSELWKKRDSEAYPTTDTQEALSEYAPLPIPERTNGRDPRIQDAARLYIHARICSVSRLSEWVGVTQTTLRSAMRLDEWDEFASMLHSAQIKSVFRDDNPLHLQGQLMQEMNKELKQRIDMLHDLQHVRDKLMRRLNDADDTEQGKLLTNVARINKQIDDLLALKELEKIAVQQVGEQSESDAGVVDEFEL